MPAPTHEDISRLAEKLWNDQGRPAGRDDAIWLEAERQLAAPDHAHAHPLGESHSEHALAEQASTQRKQALAPRRPSKSAPKSPPPETGKPLWSQPHSR